jgi:beta-lactamase regulating signal transducer with metallopeptidase domain
MSGTLDLVLRNLAAWGVQVGVLGLVAAALSRLLPVERPAARLALGQALLALVLGLPLLQPWTATAEAVSWSFAVAPSGAVPPGSSAQAVVPPAIPLWPAAVTAVLFSGAAVRLVRLGAGLVRLRSLSRGARPLEPPPWLRGLRDELAPRTRFLLSDETGIPATFGVHRPVVLLPLVFESMGRERQEAVALHELVHARRADWLVLVLEDFLKAVLFFHPAVHWLVSRIRLAREQTVDTAVVRRLGGREVYLDSLIQVARLAARARAVPAAPFLRESHLRERVDLLLKEVLMSRVRTVAHVGLTAAALVFATSWASSAVPLQTAKPAAPDVGVAIPDKGKAPAPAPKVAISDEAKAPAEPKLVHKVDPVYPPEARKEGIQGLFVIDVVIGKDGAIKDARVVVSAPTAERLKELEPKKGTPAALEGDARLAAAALDAVKQWRYDPILMGGKPAEFKATLTVNFRLS